MRLSADPGPQGPAWWWGQSDLGVGAADSKGKLAWTPLKVVLVTEFSAWIKLEASGQVPPCLLL